MREIRRRIMKLQHKNEPSKFIAFCLNMDECIYLLLQSIDSSICSYCFLLLAVWCAYMRRKGGRKKLNVYIHIYSIRERQKIAFNFPKLLNNEDESIKYVYCYGEILAPLILIFMYMNISIMQKTNRQRNLKKGNLPR
jgi:hypothetical protein